MIEMETSSDPREKDWNEHYKKEAHALEDEDDLPPPHTDPNLWQIGAGTMVMLLGVLLPALTICVGCTFSFEGIWRLTLLHPVETAIEGLLLLSVPIANYKAWSSLCHKDFRRPIRLGILNGVAIAVPAITLSVSLASFTLSYPLVDAVSQQSHSLSLALMGLVSGLSLLTGLYLTHSLRVAKQTRDARVRTVLYSLMGVGLTLLSFAGAESRSAYIRVAQSYALADDEEKRAIGLSRLREASPEKELKMVCADPHAAGLAGMFLPLDAGAEKRLYFAATGKPYRDRQSTNMSLMSNDYLRNHVVGAQIEGLSLHRSAIFGKVHPETLTSTLNWSFIFKNSTYMNQEARAEIAIPEGAVISDLTLWINGEAHRGAVGATENSNGSATSVVTLNHQSPAVITDLGRGRYLLQASPVPGQGELKVQIAITEPLKLDGGNNASFGMPRFIDSNFALTGQHELTIRSNEKMVSALKAIKPIVTTDGANLLSGELNEDDISKTTFSVKLNSPVNFSAKLISDPFSAGMKIKEEMTVRNTTAPRHLVVVVDSSQAMQSRIEEVIAAINKIPAQVKTTIMLAGDNETNQAYSREEGIQKLKSNKFGGGQDNLFALVKAAERAGESKGGAVLWIHGPQPGYNDEMYLMAPYAAPPKFFEMALDDCLTDVNEFFKNHKEVGPFAAIPRSGPLGDDLQSFLSKWQPGATETNMTLEQSTASNNIEAVTDTDAAREVAILKAADSVKELLARGVVLDAARLSVQYHIVTPVSGAVVLNNPAVQTAPNYGSQFAPLPTPEPSSGANLNGSAHYTGAQTINSGNAPMLQGAVNGAIGPQGADATVIQGINTAGTVRVNNLANLEALLNIFANGGEIIGLALGIANVVLGLMGKGMEMPFKLQKGGRIVFGVALLLFGLALPGCINWMVASARDANLFD